MFCYLMARMSPGVTQWTAKGGSNQMLGLLRATARAGSGKAREAPAAPEAWTLRPCSRARSRQVSQTQQQAGSAGGKLPPEIRRTNLHEVMSCVAEGEMSLFQEMVAGPQQTGVCHTMT